MANTIPDITEAETRSEHIDPALQQQGWDGITNVRREYSITAGRINPDSTRQKTLQADYVLTHKNQILAVLEAKKQALNVSEGVA